MSFISTVQQTHTRGNGSLEQRIAKLSMRVARLEKALEQVNNQAGCGDILSSSKIGDKRIIHARRELVRVDNYDVKKIERALEFSGYTKDHAFVYVPVHNLENGYIVFKDDWQAIFIGMELLNI